MAVVTVESADDLSLFNPCLGNRIIKPRNDRSRTSNPLACCVNLIPKRKEEWDEDINVVSLEEDISVVEEKVDSCEIDNCMVNDCIGGTDDKLVHKGLIATMMRRLRDNESVNFDTITTGQSFTSVGLNKEDKCNDSLNTNSILDESIKVPNTKDLAKKADYDDVVKDTLDAMMSIIRQHKEKEANNKDGKEDEHQEHTNNLDYFPLEGKEIILDDTFEETPDESSASNYDTEPAELYKAIDTTKWKNAFEELRMNPQDAKKWIYRANQSGKIDWMFLPIHAACFSGAPPNLVRKLIKVYPQSVSLEATAEKLPIHIACETAAHPGVIASLISAFPDSIYEVDIYGNTPLQLAIFSTEGRNRSRTLKMLSRIAISGLPSSRGFNRWYSVTQNALRWLSERIKAAKYGRERKKNKQSIHISHQLYLEA
jgi:hypothetical protein